jgi:hypothetical protein
MYAIARVGTHLGLSSAGLIMTIGEEINMQRGGPDNRGTRYACEHRARDAETNLEEFRAMRDGKYKAGEAFLRMKQSLTDPKVRSTPRSPHLFISNP